MPEFDLIIRNGTVVTAGDTTQCDIGIRDGKVATLAGSLTDGAETIDATDRLVLPGGIDSHCHIAQPGSHGVESADDFESGSISAACGGTTTIIPFAAQYRGQSLRAVVDDYHERARGQGRHRLCLSLDHLRSVGSGRGTGFAGANSRGLHLVQGVHDL